MGHLQKLKDLVFHEKRTISIRDIYHHLNVHVSEARRILDDLVSKDDEHGKLNITYLITGTGLDSTDDYKIHKVSYAKADDLDEVKKGFATVTSCKVFSVSLKDGEPTLKKEDDKEPLLDKDTLIQHQRLTYIVNDDISLRPDLLERLKLISGISVNGSNAETQIKYEKKKESEKESKIEVKKETKSSSKRTATNRRNNNKNTKQSKLSGFGTKVSTNEKTNSSGDSGYCMESTPDPFSDEEEEEKSPEREEEEEMEVETSPPTPSPPAQIIESDDDEAIVMQEVRRRSKKESKKRKRVLICDSDEEDEEALALRILAGEDAENSNHADRSPEPEPQPEEVKPMKKSKKKSKPSQPMEVKTVPEEYEDEDGYTQVRMVKKMIPVEEKVKLEDANDNQEDVKPQVKTSNKRLRVMEEDKEDKPKGKKLSKAAQAKKGLVSITSFFKPVNT